MGLLIGLIIASVGYYLAIEHLQQTVASYYDFVALAVVWAGTVSVSIITIPKIKKRAILRYLLRSLFGRGVVRKNFVYHCMNILKAPADSQFSKKDLELLEFKVLRDGLELIGLGFEQDKILDILGERIHNTRTKSLSVANWIRGLSKYPPAFGLTGTVLGLIHLMRGVSDGIDPKETGIRMAIALVATFYGLLIANLFVNPLGEMLIQENKKSLELSEIAIETIKLCHRQANLLEAQEYLNSYLDDHEKINILSDIGSTQQKAA